MYGSDGLRMQEVYIRMSMSRYEHAYEHEKAEAKNRSVKLKEQVRRKEEEEIERKWVEGEVRSKRMRSTSKSNITGG